ncbi:MAG TPA: hypothetical protein PK177_23380, partial [Burkholderiaceae bacterium]|nr:hypothetical protein [Burkholderiaceae bacterium]
MLLFLLGAGLLQPTLTQHVVGDAGIDNAVQRAGGFAAFGSLGQGIDSVAAGGYFARNLTWLMADLLSIAIGAFAWLTARNRAGVR